MAESEVVNPDAQVSHEQDGRVLTGVGVDAEQLAETMERHAPPEPEPPAAPTQPATPATPIEEPKLTRGRQRFSDLTRERDEAKAAADAAKAEREAAIRERDELKARLSQPVAEPAKPEPAKPAAEFTPTRPLPTEDEIGTKYKDYPEFVRDLARWEYEQARAQSGQSEEQRVREVLAAERRREDFQSRVQAAQERARKVYSDFDALLDSPTGAMPLGRTREESIERVDFIARHPQSEHIQYAILKDAALAQRLQTADPYTFGVTIAGLVPAARESAPRWTPPPSPHPTVGASTPTTPTASHELVKKAGYDFDKSGYREKRAAERGVTAKR